MSLQPVNYPGVPKRLTAGTLEPQPGQPAHDFNLLDDFVSGQLVPAVNALLTAVKQAGQFRWEVVDARASLGKASAVRGDPALVSTFGAPYRVEWLIDPAQAIPANFYEGGRVVSGRTYPGDYAIEVQAAA